MDGLAFSPLLEQNREGLACYRVGFREAAQHTSAPILISVQVPFFSYQSPKKNKLFLMEHICDLKVEAFKGDRTVPENLVRARLQRGALGEKKAGVAHEKIKS